MSLRIGDRVTYFGPGNDYLHGVVFARHIPNKLYHCRILRKDRVLEDVHYARILQVTPENFPSYSLDVLFAAYIGGGKTFDECYGHELL